MSRPDVKERNLPCEVCGVLVEAWVDMDQYLDKTVAVRCPSHRTPTSTP